MRLRRFRDPALAVLSLAAALALVSGEPAQSALLEFGASEPGLGGEFAAPEVELPASLGPERYVARERCSDSNPGTAAAPWCTLRRALRSVEPGERVLLGAGTYDEQAEISTSGTASAPITLEPYPGDRVVLTSQLVVRASRVRVTGFVFDGGHALDTTLIWVTDSATDVEISYNEITRAGLLGTESKDGNGIYSDPGTERLRIVGNVIHDNGTSATYHHGVYLSGRGHLIVNNVIAGNAAFGIQLYPDSIDALVAGNTIVGNGRSAIVIGSEEGRPSSGNVVVNNILAHNGTYAVETYWGGATGFGNVVANDLVWENGAGSAYGDGLTRSHLLSADPRFVDRAPGDYRLAADSPAIDAAIPAYATSVDLGRDPRLGGPDLGAYEGGERRGPQRAL